MKKIIILIIIILIFLTSFFILQKTNEKNTEEKILKNLVIIKKVWKVILSWEEVFSENSNPDNIISNWFFINKNTILTTAHSVWDYNDIYRIYAKSQVFKAKFLEKDEQKDLAKLQISKDFKNFEDIKINKNIKNWDKIFSYLYNLNTKKIQKKSWEIINISGNKIYSNIKFEKWNSGSPLFSENGEIIWINTGFDLENNLGISIIL